MQIPEFYFPAHFVKGCNCGSLISIEELESIPFKFKRVYFIYGVGKNIVRGKHAHISSTQVLVCISGSCEITLDDGKKRKTIILNSPNSGILQKKMIWGEMRNFSKDCVLMVLSNELYNEDEYIRDYEEFQKLLNQSEHNYEYEYCAL